MQEHPFPLPPLGKCRGIYFVINVNFSQLPTVSVTKTVTGVDAVIRALQRASNKHISVKESPDEKKNQISFA